MRLANLGGRPVVLVDGGPAAGEEAGRAGLLAHPLDVAAEAGPERGRTAAAFIEAIERWSELAPAALGRPPLPVTADQLGPPVPRPGQVLGAPVNYRDHQAEMNAAHTIAGLGFFLKSPSSVVGPNGHIGLPFPDRRTDQEAELGVVIGATTSHATAEAALDAVFGYTCLVDVTVRGDEERSTRKSFAGFTPTGPWIVTADEIPDPNDLRIRGWVNGQLRQDASTSAMVYGVADLIELLSSVVTLSPGDIIATGTPAGVGPIGPGDVVTVEIERVGRLDVPVVADRREPHPLWLTRAAP